ncbi:MAG: glycosyltransferase family 4 protein [Kiritimatiellae bacterium]|nr:glycosyltransferase family 4 protein [Kiritimatiellia bacterium]
MGVTHIIPGIDDPTCGIAVAAKQLIARGVGEAGEVWVHSMWTPLAVKASFWALLTGKKLVRMPHGCTDPAKLRYHWHKKRWIAPIERWLFRRADRLIATCSEEVEWIKAFEPKVKRVEVVPLSPVSVGLVLCPMSPVGYDSAQTSMLKLLYVGRLHPLKGVNFLLEALPEECKLVVIGKDDGEGKKLRKIVQRLSLDVEFKGVVSESEKEAAYQWCDVLVLPTLSENFGLVVAEALERGKRVITTDGAPAWGDGNDYGGRLIYLKGYRGGTPEERVLLLKNAINKLKCHC